MKFTSFPELIKSTSGLIVLGGLTLSFFGGKFWIVATGVAYILVNVPSLFIKAKAWIEKQIN